MKITYIIFSVYFICFTSQCFGEDETKGKTITSSYSYSIEYNDSDNGNFGHKLEVKDGNAKLNVRSDNPKQYTRSNDVKEHVPQKKSVYSKPKEEIMYVPQQSQIPQVHQVPTTAATKISQSYTSPQVQIQPQKSPLVDAALQKYSQQQLSILLSHNKNPFLPLDPKDSINKFINQYVKQTGQNQAPQTVNHGEQVPQVSTNYGGNFGGNYGANYGGNYQVQSPAVNVAPSSKPQYEMYYPPVQQNQQYYYQPSAVQSPAPQSSSTPHNQVQYVYVPQSIPPSAPQAIPQPQMHYMPLTHTGPVQFVVPNQEATTPQQQYYPQFVLNSIPKTVSYPPYGVEHQQVQPVQQQQASYSSGYTSSIPSAVASPVQEKQYVSVPSSTPYQSSQVSYVSKAPNEANYQYGSSTGYTGNSAFKPSVQISQQAQQPTFDFSKFAQFVPSASKASSSPGPNYVFGQSAAPNYLHTSSSVPVQTTLFSGLNASPSYGAYTSSSPSSPEANKFIPNYSSAPSPTPNVNYKPITENPAPAALKFQSSNVNKIPTPAFDFSKYQGLFNSIPSTSLNQISNVHATDNHNRHYAIDIKQGTTAAGASQVAVQTHYNLGAQNTHATPQATDNSNVRYVYVPTYVPASPTGPHAGQ